MATPRRQDIRRDLVLLEPLLYTFWAPQDADPQQPAEFVDGATGNPTINDVIRARRAYERLRSFLQDY